MELIAVVSFENTISEENIERLKKEFINKNYCEEDPPSYIDYEKGILYKHNGSITFEEEFFEEKFEDELNQILFTITNKIKTEIKHAKIFFNKEDLSRYFDSIIDSLKYCEVKNKNVYDKFNICYKPKETIISYLQDQYNYKLVDNTNKTDNDLIHSIFDFMKGENQKREVILNNEDFNSLILYINQLINYRQAPAIKEKLKPRLKNGELSFCFWVLHKELYGSTRISDVFISFLKVTFDNFKEASNKSIKSKFGSKKDFYSHDFFPKIIKDYTEN